MVGSAVGLVEWRKPGKYAGRVDRIDVGSAVADLSFRPFQDGLLGIVAANGVNSLTHETNGRRES